MKKLNILIIALASLFLFTGCGIKEVPTDFNAEYTNPILKNNLKQTDKLSINISPNNEFYLLQAEQKFIGAGLRLKVEEKTNTLVLKEVLNKYFKTVNIGNEKADLNIQTKVNSFTFYHAQTGALKEAMMSLHIIVNKGDKEILNKVYTENPEYIDNSILFTWRLTMDHVFELKNEDYHRGLAWIYEKKFKPDLLEALKNNM